MEKRKSTGLLLSILGVISLILITAGVTYAFFSYTKEGTQPNTITSGTILFKYTEGANALTLTNASPIDDTTGMEQTNGDANANPAVAGQNFEFTITSSTPSSAEIRYVITAKKLSSSTLPSDQVKIYLNSEAADDSVNNTTTNWTVNGDTVYTYDELYGHSDSGLSSDYDWIGTGDIATLIGDSKLLFAGVVPANQASNAYNKTFKLGMWLVDGDTANGTMADYSAYEFVKKSVAEAATTNSQNYLAVSSLSRETGSEEILTSTEYYLLNDTNRAYYERIAYVNETAGYIITESQATAASDSGNSTTRTISSSTVNFTKNEQYYPLNGKTFSVKINVYAEGATVYSGE